MNHDDALPQRWQSKPWLLWAWIVGAVLVMGGLFAGAWAVRWLLAGTRVDRKAEYFARGGYGRP